MPAKFCIKKSHKCESANLVTIDFTRFLLSPENNNQLVIILYDWGITKQPRTQCA